MNRVMIDASALEHNIRTVDRWLAEQGASWTLVTKSLCGHTETLESLPALGVCSVGDSRMLNIKAARAAIPDSETWYLRLPHLSEIQEVIAYTDVSLNSELEVIARLNIEARKQDRLHGIIIMIELGDLREGILPGSLVKFYEQVFELSNINVLGIGANLGCLSGTIPSIDQVMQLVLYKELLELKFQHPLKYVSGGTSAILPLLRQGAIPKTLNHFRIGESVYLGTDILHGGSLPGLRDDAFILEAEIAEIKEKSLVPSGETGDLTPFDPLVTEETAPGRRGYRAVLTIGQLDTDVANLKPVNPEYQLAGASSDLSVINLGDSTHGLKVGDTIQFRPGYSALVHLMHDRYIPKQVLNRPSTDFSNPQEGLAGLLRDERSKP